MSKDKKELTGAELGFIEALGDAMDSFGNKALEWKRRYFEVSEELKKAHDALERIAKQDLDVDEMAEIANSILEGEE